MKLKSVVGTCQFKKKEITEVLIWQNFYLQTTQTDDEVQSDALEELLRTFPTKAGYYRHEITSVCSVPERWYEAMREYLMGLN